MYSFLPSTKQLFKARQVEWPNPQSEEQADNQYVIDSVLTDWHNELYGQLDENVYEHGTWPASVELLAALRASLLDQRGNSMGEKIAYSLVRCGCRAEATLAALCSWDAQLFRWSAAKLKAEDLLAKFQAIGAAGEPTLEQLQNLNQWLADPAANLIDYSSGNLTGTIFNKRAFIGALYHDGGAPEYAELFSEIARHAAPALPISNVTQKTAKRQLQDVAADIQAQMADLIPPELKDMPIFKVPKTVWHIAFNFAGQPESIYVPGDSTLVNDIGVALQFNRILERGGRSERVIRFGNGRNDDGAFWGQYIIAKPAPFAALCREIGVPLNDFTGDLKAWA